MVHSLIMRFEHNDIAIVVEAHSFRLAQIGLRHLPRKQKFSVPRKFLHPPGHIDHVKIIASIHRQRPRLIELSRARSAPPYNLDSAKKLALLGGLAAARQQER